MHLEHTTKQTAVNRPVLLDLNNEPITMGDVRERGFKSKYLYLTFVCAHLYNVYIFINVVAPVQAL